MSQTMNTEYDFTLVLTGISELTTEIEDGVVYARPPREEFED